MEVLDGKAGWGRGWSRGGGTHYCQVTAGQLRLLLTVAWTQYLILIPPSSTPLPLIDEILSALVRLTPPDSPVFDNVSRHHRAPALLRSLRASPFDELCFYRNEMKKKSPNWCLIQRRLNRCNSSAIFNVTPHVKLLSNSASESIVDRSLNNISPSHQHWSHFIRIPRPKGGRRWRRIGGGVVGRWNWWWAPNDLRGEHGKWWNWGDREVV